jgi:glucose-6-phosphate isomerase
MVLNRKTMGKTSKKPGALSWHKDVLADLEQADVVTRIWARDYTVWKPDPADISNRLGWLTVNEFMYGKAGELKSFVEEIKTDGITNAVLLGMGGSSLCAEVLARTFGSGKGYPRLTVLDSTVPGWIRAATGKLDLKKTLFIVSSKSGGTIEVMSFFRHFWERTKAETGDNPGRQFIAITDSGTSLEALAKDGGHWRAFLRAFAIRDGPGGHHGARH